MKKLIILLAILSSCGLYAHQADISSTMLVEQEEGNWQLIVATSLTAFEYEVETHFGKDAYTTPQGFEELVLRHMLNTISIRFNDGEEATLTSGRVALGHETTVAFTVRGIPENIHQVEVTNTAFADIHRNQSALVVLKKDVTKKQFMLGADNNHKVRLALDNNTLREVQQAGLPVSSIGLVVLTAVILVLLGIVTYRNREDLLPV
ncbi:DUF6702 family protein [Neolewinella persica]|uniref:DUF6702 family protein n=1 Tax=Neolewinella persica TaxID=70998 RepID=UPI00036B22CD|nr:DUF6702 family protein [Neolewinella persica]